MLEELSKKLKTIGKLTPDWCYGGCGISAEIVMAILKEHLSIKGCIRVEGWYEELCKHKTNAKYGVRHVVVVFWYEYQLYLIDFDGIRKIDKREG